MKGAPALLAQVLIGMLVTVATSVAVVYSGVFFPSTLDLRIPTSELGDIAAQAEILNLTPIFYNTIVLPFKVGDRSLKVWIEGWSEEAGWRPRILVFSGGQVYECGSTCSVRLRGDHPLVSFRLVIIVEGKAEPGADYTVRVQISRS